MTCARREAGAHRPAPSAGSPRKSDPRPGRRRARLSLLPALALLFGALGLFAAAPASADVLVSNMVVHASVAPWGTNGGANAQGFTTGSASAGYVLTSIEAILSNSPNNLQRGNIRAELWSAAAGGGPGSKVANLTVPSSVSAGTVSFAAPANTVLSANTTYYFVPYTLGSFNMSLHATSTGNEDPGGQAGWGIEDAVHFVNTNQPGGSWTKSDGESLRIRVNGSVVEVTDLTVSVDRTRVDLIWRGPAGAVTDYDVHYTSAPKAGSGAVEDDAEASGSDPAFAWVDAGHTGTGAWHSITGLTYDTTYRLRVRAKIGGVSSDWLHATKKVPLAAPGPVRALSVVGGDRSLIVSWAAPSDTGGAAVSYRTQYTWSTTIADDAPITDSSQPSRSWAERRSRNSHMATSPFTFGGLGNGAPHRARVQAYNSAGSGPWVAAGATPTATPGPRLTGLSVKVGDTLIVLTPAFASATTSYTATVPHDATGVTVTPSWAGSGRTLTVNSSGPDGTVLTNRFFTTSGTSVDAILASSGDTRMTVQLRTSATSLTNYVINVSRGPAPAATPAPPTVPRNVQVTPGDAKLTLTWQAPQSWGGGRARAFVIWWKLSSGGELDWKRASPLTAEPTDTSFEFTGVQEVSSHTVANGTAYDLRIRASSHLDGDDLYGDWVTVSGTPAAQTVAPPTVPRNVAVTPGDGKLTLTWAAPSSWGDGTATAFHVFWKLSSAGDADWQGVTIYSAAGTLVPADTSLEFTGEQLDASFADHIVTNGTAYDLRIRAVSVQSGSNLFSPWVAVYDSVPSTVPAAPTGLDVRQGDGLLDLTWTAPPGTVTGYDVHYTASSSVGRDAGASGRDPASAWVNARHTGTAASHRIAGLGKGAVYRVRVRAVNAVGDGAWAHGAQSVPNTAPGAPTHLNVAPGNARLDASWLAPSDTGGSALTGYDVHYTASASVDGDAEAGTDAATDWVALSRTEANPPAVTQAVTGLTNGTAYRLRVRAKNALGASAWLVASGTFTPTATTRPRLTGLTLAVGDTLIVLTPTFAGAKTRYTATVPHDATDVAVTPTWSDTGVDVRMHSVNASSESVITNSTRIASSGDSATLDLASSGETRVVVSICKQMQCSEYWILVSRAPEPPSAPRNVQATAGDGKLTLAWGAPHTWGAAPADRFEVQWKLTSAGASAWSAVAAGGSAVDFRTTDTGFEFTGAQTDGSGNSHTVANGTGYSLRIRAVSEQSGSSHYSDWVEVSGTPAVQAVAPPTVPQNVAVTAGDGKLTLTWAAPSDWGDWTASIFSIDWKLSSAGEADWNGASPANVVAGDTSFEFTGDQLDGSFALHTVANGTAYDLRIQAASIPPSGSGSVRSPWVAVFDSVPTALPAPGAVTLAIKAGDERADLSWSIPSGTVTGYDVHYTSASADDVANDAAAGTDAATGWKAVDRGTEADPPVASQAVTGLTNGTPYRFRVRAKNGASAGPWEFGVVWPAPPVPGAVTGLTVAAGDGKLDVSWTAPSGTVTGYSVDYTSASADDVANDGPLSADAATGWKKVDRGTEADPPAASQAITGLTNGTVYRVRVRAWNGGGTGPWEFGGGTPVAPAGAVTGLTVTAGDRQLDLSWTAPSGTVAGYDVHYTSAPATGDGAVANDADAGSDPATAWVAVSRTEADPPAATQSVTGLHDGTAYRVRVRAKKGASAGAWEFGTGTTASPAPTSLTVTEGDGRLNLSWGAPSNAAAGLAGYDVHYTSAPESGSGAVDADADLAADSNPATGWVDASHTGTTATQAITGLANGTAYRVRVRAVYAEGHSVWLPGTGTPQAGGPSYAAPPGLAVTPRDGRLDLLWRAPDGATITGYDVHYTSAPESGQGAVAGNAEAGTDAATAWVPVSRSGTGISQAITGLSNGTAYRVRVRATGASGNGAWAFGDGTPGEAITVTLSVSPNPVPEGASVVVTATLSSPVVTAAVLRIALTLTDGTAEPGDHGTVARILIDRGDTRGAVTIATMHDADAEDETFTVALDTASLPSALTAGSPHAVEITIVDDEGTTPLPTAGMHSCPPSGTEWSSTLTAERKRLGSNTLVGYERSANREFGTLASTRFGTRFGYRNRAVYGFEQIVYRTSSNSNTPDLDDTLVVNFDKAYTDDMVATLALHAGGRVFRFADAAQSPGKRSLTWSGAGLGWVTNERIGLCLTDTVVTLSASPNRVRKGETLTLRATVPHPLTSAVTIPVEMSESQTRQRPKFVHGFPGITIPAGAAVGTGTIDVPHDDDVDWTLRVNLGEVPAPLVAGNPTVVRVTILDVDDPAEETQPVDSRPMVKLSVNPDRVPEGGPVGVSVLMSSGLAADVTIPVTVTRGASEERDHGTLDEGVLIPAGTCCRTALIHTYVDGDTDDETFTVALDEASLPASVRLDPDGPDSVAVTIVDNREPPPVVTIAPGGAVIEGAPAVFTLTAAPAPAADLGVSVTVSESGAFAEASALGARTVTIPAGQASASFEVATVDDAVDEPDGAIVAALGTGEGYTAGDAARASVAVADDDLPLPGIVTESSVAREGTNDQAFFRVRLDGAASAAVSVDYATADGTGVWSGAAAPATAGADYTATSGTLTFAPGETLKTVEVPILDDAVDEGTEYFWLRFSNPRGATVAAEHRETVGLIVNDDHLQAMWLARFGRTVGSQVTEAVSDRLGAGLAPGAHVTLAGQALDLSKAEDGRALAEAMTGLARRFGASEATANDDPGSGSGAGGPFAQPGLGDPWNDRATATAPRSMTGREVLLGSSFHVAPANEGSGPALAAWGRVAQAGFDGEHEDDTGTTRVDGEVVTGVLGADADWGRVLAGVAVSLSEGEGTFDAPDVDKGQSGKIESTMTTVSPYARLKLTERVSAWGLAGWGTGDMTIRFDDGSMAPIRTDLSMQLGAVGARGELLTQGPDGGMDLALKADAFFVRTKSEKAANSAETEADASRVRLVLEGGRRFALSDTATLRPSLELGVRQDGGDAETGAGFEVGGGVAWTDAASGLSIEAKGRMLVAHADSDYEEWGASATATLEPGERGRGLSFSLAPTIGATSSGSERLWGAQRPRELAPDGGFEAARGLQAEAGYGLALFGGRFTGTPNLGFGMADGGARDYRLGWRLTSAIRGDPGFEVNLDAVRREAANENEPPEHGVMLRSLIRW